MKPDLESIAVMFEKLAVPSNRETPDEWVNGYREGLSDTYQRCAQTIRNEIARTR
jgi:hypothetical protein